MIPVASSNRSDPVFPAALSPNAAEPRIVDVKPQSVARPTQVSNPAIRETLVLKDILVDLRKGAVVLLDLDLTLWDSTEPLNCEVWRHFMYRHICELHQAKRIKSEPMVLLALINTQLNLKVPLKLLESDFDKAIADAQQREVVIVGLTGRVQEQREETEKQLQSVGVKLCEVFYTDRKPKGPFMTPIKQKYPDADEFVHLDDNIDHIRSVQTHLANLNVKHTCYHYVAPVPLWERFEKSTEAAVAVVQFRELLFHHKLISKSEAEKMLPLDHCKELKELLIQIDNNPNLILR